MVEGLPAENGMRSPASITSEPGTFPGAMGRFTTPDKPFADRHSADPQSWNLYAYAGNNPLRYFDDWGERTRPAQTKFVNDALASDPTLRSVITSIEPTTCWSGGTGRRTGLKIPRPSLGMWVRPPPPAPSLQTSCWLIPVHPSILLFVQVAPISLPHR